MLLNLLVIQPIDLCNLNCSYCYLPGRRDKERMPASILADTFKCVFNSSLVQPIHADERLKILWHAGEPLLAGIPFYQNALELLKKYNTRSIPLNMDFQTNATPITQAWCDFIKKHHITLSVSVDGPAFLHDRHRRNWRNQASFDMVMRGIQLLKKNQIPLRAICVLTRDSLAHPHAIYEFFMDNGFESVGFSVEEKECHNTESSMSAGIIPDYELFMSTIYDRWRQDHQLLQIREFNSVLGAIASRKAFPEAPYLPSAEVLPFNILTVNKDGFISTFSPELTSGTLQEPKKFIIGHVSKINSIDELIQKPAFQEQLVMINRGIAACAKECDYFEICGGGSASNKFYEHGRFDVTETSACLLSKKTLTDVLLKKLGSDRVAHFK